MKSSTTEKILNAVPWVFFGTGALSLAACFALVARGHVRSNVAGWFVSLGISATFSVMQALFNDMRRDMEHEAELFERATRLIREQQEELDELRSDRDRAGRRVDRPK